MRDDEEAFVALAHELADRGRKVIDQLIAETGEPLEAIAILLVAVKERSLNLDSHLSNTFGNASIDVLCAAAVDLALERRKRTIQ
jgi:hypothetical protein